MDIKIRMPLNMYPHFSPQLPCLAVRYQPSVVLFEFHGSLSRFGFKVWGEGLG
ncbi:hypothetical protein EJ02DRAFT_455201 [Clathrospora elynae]|uniref:Uncharacterized protein n=1 Tax=Clathrospora elynae TaxID=706981 RepID=A0A6A5SMM6_9PLEO|nr:hypothetical protein EJ02DRAFT_455201 [Clathrospora elynae]